MLLVFLQLENKPMKDSLIQWCHDTWNFIFGCSFASKGCPGCYALSLANIRQNHPNPKISDRYQGLTKKVNNELHWSGEVRFDHSRLSEVLKLGSPTDRRMIFVCNQSDIFHPKVSFDDVDVAIAYTQIIHWNTYQLLTKRPNRMLQYFADPERPAKIKAALDKLICQLEDKIKNHPTRKDDEFGYLSKPMIAKIQQGIEHAKKQNLEIPLDNIWTGCSVCNQEDAEKFLPDFIQIPSRLRFLSCEPLTSTLDLSEWLLCQKCQGEGRNNLVTFRTGPTSGYGRRVNCDVCHGNLFSGLIRWVIAGGHSLKKADEAFECKVEWLRSLQKQCQSAKIPFFMKQLGTKPTLNGELIKLEDKKGGDISEWESVDLEDLKVREFPALS